MLRLFLGPGAVRLFRLSSRTPEMIDALAREGRETDGIILFGEGDERSLRRSLAAGKRILREDAGVGLLVRNRARAALASLLDRQDGSTARGPTLRAASRALRQAHYHRCAIHAITRKGGRMRIAARSPADVWRAEHYFVVAHSRPHDNRSQLDSIVQRLDEVFAAEGEPRGCRWVEVSASAKDKSLLVVARGDQQIIVRIPHTPAAFAAESRAHGMLVALWQERRLVGRVPRPLAAEMADGQAFFAETRSPGTPLASHLSPATRGRYAAQVSNLLTELNGGPDAGPSPGKDSCPALDLVPSLVEPVLARLGDSRLRRRTLELLARHLRDARYRTGRMHGDLSVSNLLVAAGSICGLIDWENAAPAGPMLLDAFNYLDSVQRHCGRMTLADTIPMLAHGTWPEPEERLLLERHFAFCGSDLRHRAGFALLYFFAHVGPQLHFATAGSNVEERVRSMLERVLAATGSGGSAVA